MVLQGAEEFHQYPAYIPRQRTVTHAISRLPDSPQQPLVVLDDEEKDNCIVGLPFRPQLGDAISGVYHVLHQPVDQELQKELGLSLWLHRVVIPVENEWVHLHLGSFCTELAWEYDTAERRDR